MTSIRGFVISIAVFCIGLAPASGLRGADWPAYRHDLARSGVTQERLQVPLHRQWSYVAAHAPRPAWPEPGRELNRLAFDYACEVTVASGLVYFGSSADHKVYALDLGTGQERWSFFTEGPVRFAPTTEGERVFVACDDGWLYCLSAAEGKLLWRFHGGPREEKVMGNEQMISRWPLRAGVGVEDGIVYFAAGMWPSEGVYVYALRAEDGKILWENNTSGTNYVKQPHPGSFSMTGVAPQGYVLGHRGQIFVPTGRNVPAAYDRETGKLLYYRSAPTSWGNRWGGSWNFLASGLLFGWRCHHGPDIDVRLGEYPPDKNDGIVVFDAKTGKERREFPGKLRAVVSGDTLYASGSGKVTAYDLRAWVNGARPTDCTKWETPHGRAYSVIMAGNTLVVGGRGTVTAIDADKGQVVWQDKVKGQARGLAVANGRLLVSTTEGRIACYGPKAVAQPSTISPKRDASPFQSERPDSAAARMARRIIDETGKTAGYCLALGAGDGRLLYHLAKHSELNIYCVEPDAREVASVRQALDAARLYGVRVTVHHGSLRELTYPDYFADLIIMGDGTSRRLKRCSAEELYRVLRPCGGNAYIPPAQATGISLGGVERWVRRIVSLGSSGPFSGRTITSWLRRGRVPEEEIGSSASAVQVVRGKLPGAANWTHQYANAARTGCSADQRVRVPLKLLWFGRPGPARLISRHWGGPAPLCVNGRMFVIGQHSLIAADAYNGRPLWRRDLPRVGWWHVRAKGSSAAADEDSVYLVQGKTCLRLDAATGETVQTYRLPAPPPDIPKKTAKSLRWSYLAVDHDRILGSMGDDREGRCVFALDKDGKPCWTYAARGAVNNNSLSMDESRVYLIDRTSPGDVARAKRRGKTIAAGWTLVALDAATGKIVWQTDEGVSGRTELWLSRGVLLATSGSGMTGYEAATGKPLYVRQVRMGRFPAIAGDTIYAEPAAYELRTGEPNQRTSSFTGEKAPWNFHRSYGCGSIAGGPTVLLFRSGTLGIYDLAGDGGVYNFGGIRAGCYVNAIAANGLVLCPPADAGCTCSYSFRTTVALMPAEQQRDWSIFYDRLPKTSVKRAAFNLGAPGDRRDQAGTMWLALPRPGTRSHRSDIAVPFRFTVHEGFGPYRQNLDRARIARTDRPWIYACGLKGLQRAELDVEILDRGVTSRPAEQPPVIDGQAAEPCWDGYKAVPIAREKASVTLRHDDSNLYVAYNRPATGKWKATCKGDDATVWEDDSFELYLSNIPARRGRPSKRCLHLGVSASGARYDSSWTYVSPFPVCDIPKLDITVDGKVDDWADKGLKVLSLTAPRGKMRPPENFDPSFRIGWSEKGLLVLAQVKDDAVLESANPSRLWLGDSLEIFMTPRLGSNEAYQLVLAPGADPKHPKPRSRFYDQRRATRGEPLTAQIVGKRTQDGYLVELLLPWKSLKIRPAMGLEFGMQLFANDKDRGKGGRPPFRVVWHPGGHPFSNRDPHAYQTFRLSAEPSRSIEFKRGTKRDSSGSFTAVPPYPFPFTVPPLGAKGEDARYAGEWSSAVRADQEAFTAELAIPWKTLAEAGLDKANLMANLHSRGPLRRAPATGQGYERLILVSRDMARPRTLSVRLHFAELEQVRRGERVFDVKLQGKVVLKSFDVIRAAGGRNRAIVRQFDGIVASGAVVLELIPKAKALTASSAPVISGIEVTTPATK